MSRKKLLNDLQMYCANKTNDLLHLKTILNQDMDIINCQFENGSTILHEMVKNKDIMAIRFLIENSVNINITNSADIIPFNIIVSEYDDNDIHLDKTSNEILLLFLKNGSKLNVRNDINKVPLEHAIQFKKIYLFKNLLKFKDNIDLNYQDSDGDSFVHMACHMWNDEYLKILLQLHAPCNLENKLHKKPIQIAMELHSYEKMLLLLENKADFEFEMLNVEGFFPFLLNSEYNHLITVLYYHILIRNPKMYRTLMLEKQNIYILELQKMYTLKMLIFDRSSITYFNFLTQPVDKYVLNFPKWHLLVNEKKFIIDNFLLYDKLLIDKFNKFQIRHKNLLFAMQYLYNCVKGFEQLPLDICKIIVKLLTNQEINSLLC